MLSQQQHGGGSGRPGRYHRVPTGSSYEDGGGGSATVSSSDRGAAVEDPLQQSLLVTASTDNEEQLPTSPTASHSAATVNAGNTAAAATPSGWQSPPQLHCAVKYILETWTLIFPHIRRMGAYLYCITLLTMLVVVPMVTYTAIEEHRFDFAAFDSAGVMVLGTLVLSFRLVYLHLTHWYMPEVQKYVVRIVWMVPLYSVQSWLALRFPDARLYIDAIRDLYEAFVIASFLYYLIELLGGQEALVRTLESKRETQPHLGKHGWPLSYLLHDWELGMEFMMQCKHGVLQYVVVKTGATVLTYLFEITGCYGEGQFQWNMAYPYLAFLLNTSVMYALYVLVMLFHAVREELKHPVDWRPLGKFLCVKGVVFFTWWQGVIIFYLQNKGFIKDTGSWSGDEISNALIDYCVCTEMVFFAVAHSYTFTYKEYLPSSIPPELRNLTLNANVNANVNTYVNANANNTDIPSSASMPHPLRLEPSQSTMSLASTNSATQSNVAPTYRPPAVLDQPLNFKEAFWSSSIPKDTYEDILRLRSGIVRGGSGSGNRSGAISLQEIQTEAEAVVADATATGNAAQAVAAAAVAAAASEAAHDVPDIVTDDEQSADIEQAVGTGEVARPPRHDHPE